jgi:dipeptidyl aminopeptidase/acylaminoacyl peptidase
MVDRISLALFILIGFSTNSVFANQIVKIEEFVKLPNARDVQVSPDGNNFSVIFRKDNEDILAIIDMKTRKPSGMFRVNGQRKSVDKVYWANNNRLIYSVAETKAWNKTRFNNGELFGVNIDGSRHNLIFGYTAGKKQVGSKIKKNKPSNGNQKILDLLPNDEDHILIAFFPWRNSGHVWVSNPKAMPILYKLNILTGKKKKLGYLPLPYADAITDINGEVRFSIGNNDDNEQLVFYRDSMEDSWKELTLKNFEGSNLYPLSFTQDNKSVYLYSNVNNGTRALYLYNLEDQSTNKIFHDKTVDININIRDFSGNRIIAVGTDLALPKYHYLENKNKKSKLHKQLMTAFKGSDVVITSATRNGNTAIAYVYSDTNGGDYYLFNTTSLKAEYLLSKYQNIDPNLMAKTEALEFTVRDGKTIRGYLTKQESESKLPLVVLPHGGPHGPRDYWGYDWQVQLLANRGYAVLQVNYRGSGGFGKDFQEAGYGEWGASMQDDLTDATLQVIKKISIDAKRVCLLGASYGAYAALMGTVREPDLYQCAIGSAGVYNLPMMFEEGDIPESQSGIAYLKNVLGNNIKEQKQRSPVFNVEKIKANILLIHGSKDNRAPIEQVESLKDAFDAIGKKYEWLELTDEGHGYYDEVNRVTVYNKILKFLEQNIGTGSYKTL